MNTINHTDEDVCPFDPPSDPCDDDDEPPVLTCPTGTLTFECQGPEGAPIDYEVSAVDNCDVNPTITCFPPPGTVLPVGVLTTVDCTAKDDDHNKASCWFKVIVVDTSPPEISCPDDITVDCMVGEQNGAVVEYTHPMATDLCDDDVGVVCNPPSGSFLEQGCTTVTCTATDDSGNTKECTFEVCVVEETPPEITCPGDLTVECTSPDGAVVEYPPPTLSSTCNPPDAPVCQPASGSQFPLGTTVVTCLTLLDNGMVLSCDFNITVPDSQKPTVVCPNDIVAECNFTGGTSVSFNVTATDLCDETVDIVCTPPSASVFPIGTTTVTCVATDDANNTDACEFDITVRDTTTPEIICPQGPIQVSCDQPNGGGAFVNYPDPVISNECNGTPTFECLPTSGSRFPVPDRHDRRHLYRDRSERQHVDVHLQGSGRRHHPARDHVPGEHRR